MQTTIPPSPPRPQATETIGCLEMELEEHSEYHDDDPAHLYETNPLNQPRAVPVSPLVELAQGLVTYIKLWVQLYPRISLGLGIALIIWLAITAFPFSRHKHPNMTRNHLEQDYTKLSADYDLRKAKIHHWCLFGGNDNCYCEDPTEGSSREEAKGWSDSHNRNKHHIEDNAVVQNNGILDVVFYGAGVFQAWGEGSFLGRSFDEGGKIALYFNQTFRSEEAELQGLALGIYTDRSTNLLWRVQHGELPSNLQAKVFWILIGADDLALAMCSEDVVILGILRVAEEIAYRNPKSKVVIQGLLPRSNHGDGSLHITDDQKGSSFRHNSKEAPFEKTNIWAYRTGDMDPTQIDPGHSTTSSALQQAKDQIKQPYFNYYIWPSILEINNELKGFCDRSSTDQFEYFDAGDLFIEQVGSQQKIIRDLMPNSILLSYQGHKVLMDAVKEKLKQLLQDN